MQRRITHPVPTEQLAISKRAYSAFDHADQGTAVSPSYVDAVLFGRRSTRGSIAEPIRRMPAHIANEKERT